MNIHLIEIPNNDICWEGTTQQSVVLKFNQEIKIKTKMLVFRPGIYDIAKNIKYIISLNKISSYSLLHH
jgi:hypothetical protein